MSRGVDAERDTTDEPCRFLGLFAQPPDTKRTGRCPAVFCASSAGSRFHFGNLGGAAAAKTCKPLTSRTPANIGVHGPCYEMDDHALRSSCLKSSLLRHFCIIFRVAKQRNCIIFRNTTFGKRSLVAGARGRFVAPPHPIRARKFYSVCFVPALRVLKRARKVQF